MRGGAPRPCRRRASGWASWTSWGDESSRAAKRSRACRPRRCACRALWSRGRGSIAGPPQARGPRRGRGPPGPVAPRGGTGGPLGPCSRRCPPGGGPRGRSSRWCRGGSSAAGRAAESSPGRSLPTGGRARRTRGGLCERPRQSATGRHPGPGGAAPARLALQHSLQRRQAAWQHPLMVLSTGHNRAKALSALYMGSERASSQPS
mmetsp:Transcript_164126/g.398872  ORF Transcript_164126/g.398872 Transcript_164126/m.398872 type:complete len:205 (+) Transcript_164126:520-1134(+)